MSDSAQIVGLDWLERRPWIALAIIVAVVTIFNAVGVWLGQKLKDYDLLEPVTAGVWVMEPMLYGAWTALGTGFFLARLPLAALCLLLSIGSLGLTEASVGHLERYEFVALLVAGIAIYVVTTGTLLVARRFRKLRFEERQPDRTTFRFQFSIGYLLILTTLAAVVLAIFTSMTFDKPRPPTSFLILGPDFFFRVIAYGAAICFLALTPVLAMALVLMRTKRSKRGMFIVCVVWAVTTACATVAMEESWGETLLFAVLVQLGGATLAAFAVVMTRAAGFRLRSRIDDQAIVG